MILITGAHGKLGKEVAKIFPDALTPTHGELDICNRKDVFDYIRKNVPDMVIHLAALVGIPQCENNKEIAWKTNVEGTRNLIEACEIINKNCYFVLMSTPCIFNGKEETPKDEEYIPDPDNYYGFTKAMQEMVVQRSKLKWLIIRGNFVPFVKWPYPKAFVDRKSNYLFAHQLAKGMKEVINVKKEGIVHVLGDKIISMLELAHKCPDSQNVQGMMLIHYYTDRYIENQPEITLTKNMIMKSTRWIMYNIDGD